MFKYLTKYEYDELLSSFNLVNTTNIKTIKKILYSVSNNIDSHYDEVIIKKKNGKLRFLNVPDDILKNIQKRILTNILESMRISKYATAYKKEMSLKDNTKVHVNKKTILKLDIKDFFGNITWNKIYNSCFYEGLYPKRIGVLLTNLCAVGGVLPQGAPTSGYISNIVLREFDEIIGKYCLKKGINYTRYSDDMTFSGDFNVKDIIKIVKALLNKEGFKLNNKKITILTKKNRQQVTGIVVNEKISVSNKYKRKIRQEIYYIRKYGVDSHLEKIEAKDKNLYLRKLLGKINFVLQIERDNIEFENYKNKIIGVEI